jgi:hypothetical protein
VTSPKFPRISQKKQIQKEVHNKQIYLFKKKNSPIHPSFLVICPNAPSHHPPGRHSHEGHPRGGADDQQGATGGCAVGDQVPQCILKPKRHCHSEKN